MSAELTWMLLPIIACLLAVGALGWFGLHVLERGVIFVDLALAQIAALGATTAVFLGYEADAPMAMALSLLFTAGGALGFTTLRRFEDRVPQEALIGISYAVSAALGILLIELAADPHGAEKIQHLLVGNIVWVQPAEIITAAAAILGVGLLHVVFRKPLLMLSLHPEQARAAGMRIAVWDLLFYLSLGVVLTAIVNIVGVLLVFSFLVIPAVIGRLLVDGSVRRLLVGWGVGAAASILGVAVSYEHSTGPIVVSLLGAALLITLCGLSLRRSPAPGRTLALQLGSAAGVAGLMLGLGRLHAVEAHDHTEHALADHPHEVHHSDHAQHPHSDTVPAADPLSQLEQAIQAARGGSEDGLRQLAALCGSDAPFIRMEAHDRLSIIAGEAAVAYDPLAGPDTGLWAAWAEHPPAGWQDHAAGIALP
jgi:zinc/manganese transport system permease protein